MHLIDQKGAVESCLAFTDLVQGEVFSISDRKSLWWMEVQHKLPVRDETWLSFLGGPLFFLGSLFIRACSWFTRIAWLTHVGAHSNSNTNTPLVVLIPKNKIFTLWWFDLFFSSSIILIIRLTWRHTTSIGDRRQATGGRQQYCVGMKRKIEHTVL
jgi:hypothetical protein